MTAATASCNPFGHVCVRMVARNVPFLLLWRLTVTPSSTQCAREEMLAFVIIIVIVCVIVFCEPQKCLHTFMLLKKSRASETTSATMPGRIRVFHVSLTVRGRQQKPDYWRLTNVDEGGNGLWFSTVKVATREARQFRKENPESSYEVMPMRALKSDDLAIEDRPYLLH